MVRGISLTVGSGEIVALLGKNGMGKNTLLKTVMGFLPAREGQVTLYGHDVTRDSPHRIARRAIAYTPQEQAIFQDLTVGDNLRLGQSEARWFEEELERVGEVFPFLEERLGQRAGTLSGGEQKMLLIARALMEMDLAERLLLALEAGNDAGGDKRGKQSAALQVHHTESYPWLDFRVDEHPPTGHRAAQNRDHRPAAAVALRGRHAQARQAGRRLAGLGQRNIAGAATGPARWRGQRTMTQNQLDRTSPALQRIPGAFKQEDSP